MYQKIVYCTGNIRNSSARPSGCETTKYTYFKTRWVGPEKSDEMFALKYFKNVRLVLNTVHISYKCLLKILV